MTKIFFEIYANVEITRFRTFKRYKQGQYIILRPLTMNAKNKAVLGQLGLLYKVVKVEKNKVFVKQTKYLNMLDEVVLKSKKEPQDKKGNK